MPAPAVSVMMPVYNTERYLAEAVESILAQTFADFELIVIDDGSTDGSGAILERYAARDGRIRPTRRPGRGTTPTRNEILAQARGEFCAVMDSDDVALPGRLERQVAYLRAHPECVAVGSRVLLIDPDGAPLRTMVRHMTHEEIDAVHMGGATGSAICHPTTMLRRAALEAVGGYRDEYDLAEDYDLYLRLAEVGRLANLPEVLLKYRRHPQAAGHARLTQQRQFMSLAIRQAYRRRGLDPESAVLPPECRERRPAESHRIWAGWALKSGYARSARKHALAALRHAPLSLATWRLALSALRGPRPSAAVGEAADPAP
jgi:glycosyltransferase involved in cell wall biosynthesis